MKKTLSHVLSHWPAHLVWVFPVIAFLVPSLKSYEAAHPGALASQVIGIVLAVVARYISPFVGTGVSTCITLLFASLLFAQGAFAQQSVTGTHLPEPAAAPASSSAPLTNIYAAGVSWNQNATPSVAGTALYARLASDGTGTYLFTVVDALPTSTKPFTLTTDFSAGIAQKVFTLGKVPIFIPTSAGVSFSGSNTGWDWSTGAMAAVKLGKGNWRLFPVVRIARSNVSGGSGVQPIVGVMFGWGQ